MPTKRGARRKSRAPVIALVLILIAIVAILFYRRQDEPEHPSAPIAAKVTSITSDTTPALIPKKDSVTVASSATSSSIKIPVIKDAVLPSLTTCGMVLSDYVRADSLGNEELKSSRAESWQTCSGAARDSLKKDPMLAALLSRLAEKNPHFR